MSDLGLHLAGAADRPAARTLKDVKFTRAVTKAVQTELEDLASWLGLSAVEPA